MKKAIADKSIALTSSLGEWVRSMEPRSSEEILALLKEAESANVVLFYGQVDELISRNLDRLSTDSLREIVDISLRCLKDHLTGGGHFDDANNYFEIAAWANRSIIERGETYASLHQLKCPKNNEGGHA